MRGTIPKPIQTYTNQPKLTQTYPNLPEPTQTYPILPKPTQALPRTYSNLPNTIQTYHSLPLPKIRTLSNLPHKKPFYKLECFLHEYTQFWKQKRKVRHNYNHAFRVTIHYEKCCFCLLVIPNFFCSMPTKIKFTFIAYFVPSF